MDLRAKHQLAASCMPPTRNRTSNILVHRTAPSHLSHTSQGMDASPTIWEQPSPNLGGISEFKINLLYGPVLGLHLSWKFKVMSHF